VIVNGELTKKLMAAILVGAIIGFGRELYAVTP
jgi:uncharacterized membrane protein YhiD involved in acid resistance